MKDILNISKKKLQKLKLFTYLTILFYIGNIVVSFSKYIFSQTFFPLLTTSQLYGSFYKTKTAKLMLTLFSPQHNSSNLHSKFKLHYNLLFTGLVTAEPQQQEQRKAILIYIRNKRIVQSA